MPRLALLRSLLLVLALVVPAGLVAPPAQAATRTTLVLSNSIQSALAYGGDGQVKARLRTSTGRALASRTVSLWGRTAGTSTWRRLATTRTMRNGLGIFVLADQTRSTELQARFAGSSGLAPTRSGVIVQRVTAPLSSASVTSGPVFQGDAVQVRATTTSALSGTPVVVEHFLDYTWTEVGRAPVGPDGDIEVSFSAGNPTYDGPSDSYLPQQHRLRTVDGVLAPAEQSFTITPRWWSLGNYIINSGVGQPVTQTLEPQGGTAPFVFEVTGGALPPGTSLSPGGVLSGSPSSAGTYVSTVTVDDARGRTASGELTLYVSGDNIVFVTDALPEGQVGQPYDAFVRVSGAVGSVVFAMEGLPAGLGYAENGAVFGVPEEAGDFSVRVYAFDDDNNYAVKDFLLRVSAG